jgi:hypothetical protein
MGNESIKSGVAGGHNFNIWSDKMTERRPIGGLFLLWWVLASAVGWGLAMFLVVYPVRVMDRIWGFLFGPLIFRTAVSEALLGILFGVVIGTLQWLVLRRHIPRASWWIAATVAGLGLGFAASLVFSVAPDSLFVRFGGLHWNVLQDVANFLVAALILGLSQRLVLRQHFRRTWWWLLPSALASLSVFFIWGEVPSRPSFLEALGAATLGAGWGLVAGILTGITLLFISRRSKESSR